MTFTEEALSRAVRESDGSITDVKTFWPYELVRSDAAPTVIRLINDSCTPEQAATGLRNIADWLLAGRSGDSTEGK